MRSHAIHKYIVCAIMLTIGSVSQAAFVTYTDRTIWGNAGTVDATEDFESFTADASFATSPLNVGSLTFSTVGTLPDGSPSPNRVDVSPYINADPVPGSFGNANVAIFVNGLDGFGNGVTYTDLDSDIPLYGFFADFAYPGNNDEALIMTLSLLGGGTVDLAVPYAPTSSVEFGFRSNTDAITSIRFSSSVNDGFKLDNLSASTIPIPATVWLFGSGMLGLIGISRRKRTS